MKKKSSIIIQEKQKQANLGLIPESVWAHYNRLRGTNTNAEFFGNLLCAMEAEMGKEAKKSLPELLVLLRELHSRAYCLRTGLRCFGNSLKEN